MRKAAATINVAAAARRMVEVPPEILINSSVNLVRRMGKWVTFAGVVVATTAFAQPEQWLQYRTSREGRAFRWLELTTNAPPDVALPKLNAQPYFARWTTPMDPTGERWICLDRTRKTGPYDRLFIDTKGNRRLDDEAPVDAYQIDENSAFFPPARVIFQGEDGPITYHLVLRFNKYQDNSAQLLASSGGWYEGLVDLGGKKRRIQVIDGNVNGTFNDRSPNPYDCDRVRVEGDKTEERFLGQMLEVEGQLFKIKVARDGAFLKVQKAENVAFGQVRVPETISEVTAFGENGYFVRRPVNGVFELPVGNYQIYRWTIDRKDDKGAAWTLSGYGFNDSGDFEVAAARPTSLDIGEPVRAVLQAGETTNNWISFSLHLQGRLGESIEMLRGSERPRGPRLTLANLDGSFCYTNSFEFG
jgi:hypothetical protein